MHVFSLYRSQCPCAQLQTLSLISHFKCGVGRGHGEIVGEIPERDRDVPAHHLRLSRPPSCSFRDSTCSTQPSRAAAHVACQLSSCSRSRTTVCEPVAAAEEIEGIPRCRCDCKRVATVHYRHTYSCDQANVCSCRDARFYWASCTPFSISFSWTNTVSAYLGKGPVWLSAGSAHPWTTTHHVPIYSTLQSVYGFSTSLPT